MIFGVGPWNCGYLRPIAEDGHPIHILKDMSIKEYLDQLPPERKQVMEQLRQTISDNIPAGFEEAMNYGMIGFVIPHSLYPAGYHCDPKTPLPFLGIAAQKNFYALYHMGIYADPALYEWFQTAYSAQISTKLDMGKSCIRFKKVEQIPFDLIGELVSKMSVQDWISLYENAFRKK